MANGDQNGGSPGGGVADAWHKILGLVALQHGGQDPRLNGAGALPLQPGAGPATPQQLPLVPGGGLGGGQFQPLAAASADPGSMIGDPRGGAGAAYAANPYMLGGPLNPLTNLGTPSPAAPSGAPSPAAPAGAPAGGFGAPWTPPSLAGRPPVATNPAFGGSVTEYAPPGPGLPSGASSYQRLIPGGTAYDLRGADQGLRGRAAAQQQGRAAAQRQAAQQQAAQRQRMQGGGVAPQAFQPQAPRGGGGYYQPNAFTRINLPPAPSINDAVSAVGDIFGGDVGGLMSTTEFMMSPKERMGMIMDVWGQMTNQWKAQNEAALGIGGISEDLAKADVQAATARGGQLSEAETAREVAGRQAETAREVAGLQAETAREREAARATHEATKEALTKRGQDIQARGQDIRAETARDKARFERQHTQLQDKLASLRGENERRKYVNAYVQQYGSVPVERPEDVQPGGIYEFLAPGTPIRSPDGKVRTLTQEMKTPDRPAAGTEGDDY